jgi:aryl-alcohol dehydrogenase-like predicted oxidoreductase
MVMVMEYRQLGDSKVATSVLIFGAWAIGGAMWGGTDERKSIEAIAKSIDMGITSIDTAPIYGFGKSEELVGRAIAGFKREDLQILTKFGLVWEFEEGEYFFDLVDGGKAHKIYRNATKKNIIRECDNSLKRLRTDYIDLYQCHWRDHTTAVEETMEALEQLIKDGKILAAGVSNFTAEEIEAGRKVVPIASVQPPYSMVLRDIEVELLPYCRRNNVGVIVYSPMQRGVLTGKFKPDHKFPPEDHRANQVHFTAANIERINRFLASIKHIAEARQATLGQLVLAWTIKQPGISGAIVGARDAVQAEENARAAAIDLSESEIKEINSKLRVLELVSGA